ncbi:MAG: ATP-binding cassette domain-containing protein, partial [Acidimicrobiales bacterium]
MSAHLVARGLTFAHGPHTVLDGIDITLAPRERVGVLGPNGAGKTTLLRLLAGEIAPGRGHVEIHPASARVVLVPQQLRPIGGETAAELVARRTGVAALDRELASSTGALTSGEAGAEDRYSVALDRWLGAGGADLQDRLGAVFAEVGLAGDRRHQPVATMSGGERSRVGLAAILAIRADVVLLDEPTNDLDLDGLDLLEQWVAATRSTIALVSHDRAFLRRVVTAVVEIDDHHPDA